MTLPTFFRHEPGSKIYHVQVTTQPRRRLNENELVGYLRGYFRHDPEQIERARAQLAEFGIFGDDVLIVEAIDGAVTRRKRPNNPTGGVRK